MTVNDILSTLAHKSGGGDTLETLGAQEVRGVALFLADGRVAFATLETGVTADD